MVVRQITIRGRLDDMRHPTPGETIIHLLLLWCTNVTQLGKSLSAEYQISGRKSKRSAERMILAKVLVVPIHNPERTVELDN